MKHQYEDYNKFVDKEIAKRKRIFEGLVGPIPDQLNSYHDAGIASLLANKATLERHKGYEAENVRGALLICRADEDLFPCPSLLDVTNQLDEVMG